MSDAPLTVPHPLTDAADGDWTATETHARVVSLSVAMSDFLHRAAQDLRHPIVVTGPHSRMTEPLREALAGMGGHWVVRLAAEKFYDARTGLPLSRPADALLPRTGDRTPSREFARTAVATRMRIVTTFSTRHRANRDVHLGAVAEALATAYTGGSPAAWGATEPVVAPWSRPQLTEYSRRRMPHDSRWIVTGEREHPLVGTIAVARTAEGVEETTRINVDRGAVGDDRHAALADDAVEALTRAAAHAMPLIGLAIAHVGAPDLSARPLAGMPPQPLALVVGPPGLRRLGVDARAWVAGLDGRLVGRPRLPSALIPLGSAQDDGWERVSRVLASLDADRTAEALGVADWLRGPSDSDTDKDTEGAAHG
ncbi:DUF6177 family protein [Microbacterium marinum]|uniref:DUF6177 family protein n=1 Tax=Microbacterium marinum TaxID=421115 RepID=UPI0038508941